MSLRIFPCLFFIFWGHVFGYPIRLLCYVGQEQLVLSGYANSRTKINLGVELYIPLIVAQGVLD